MNNQIELTNAELAKLIADKSKTMAEIAKLLGVSRETLNKLRQQQGIPPRIKRKNNE